MSALLFWLCMIGAGALVLSGITSVWSWANQFFNWKFQPARYEAKLAEVRANNKSAKVSVREPGKPRWRRARTQQIAVLRYAYPWGLLLLAAMSYLAYRSFSLTTYVYFAACWFVLTRSRFSHKVRAAAKHNRKVHDDGQVTGHRLFQHSANEIIRHHYAWAFTAPSFTGKLKKHQKTIYWYYGPKIIRTPVNWACNAVMTVLHFSWLDKLFHFRVVLPLIAYGTLALAWPVTGTIAVLANAEFIYAKDNDQREPDVEPWWTWFTPEPNWPEEDAIQAPIEQAHLSK